MKCPRRWLITNLAANAARLAFITAAMALLLIPGPVVLYTVARSINQGRRAGFVSVLAAGIGDLCHVIAATLGLSAILLSSALAFSIVKYAGAAYLIYLGVRTLMTRPDPDQQISAPPQRLMRIFSQGIVVSVLNPKTALFFLAFLPQFVQPSSRGRKLPDFGLWAYCLSPWASPRTASMRCWLAPPVPG